jgi:hypothetical protein
LHLKIPPIPILALGVWIWYHPEKAMQYSREWLVNINWQMNQRL